MKQIKMLLLSSMAVLFVACGGGGSTTVDNTLPPTTTPTPPTTTTPTPPPVDNTQLPDETTFNWDDYIAKPTTDFSAIVNGNVAEVLVYGTRIDYRWNFAYTSGIRYPKEEFIMSISQDNTDIFAKRSSRNGVGITHFQFSINIAKINDITDGDIIGQAIIEYDSGTIIENPIPTELKVTYIDDEVIKLEFSDYRIELNPTVGTLNIYGSSTVEISPI